MRARGRALTAGASASPAGVQGPASGAPRPTPVRSADLWVSAAAVRQAIGAWAYTRTGGAPHPGDELVRAAVGVACAIAECAAVLAADVDARWAGGRQGSEAEDDGPLTRAVPYEPAHLAELAGVTARDVDRAVELLQGAGVVHRTQAGAAVRVALDAEVLASLPAAARVDWAAVRGRLAAVGAGVGAPTAVLRALAERLGAVDVARAGELPPVRASVRDLEEATRFGRSTVSDAVAALVRARVLDADTRAGHTGRFVVRPAAFGLPDDLPPAPAAVAAPASPAARDVGGGSASGAVPHTVTRGAPAVAGAPVLVGTFAGTPIYAPAGTPLVVECDAEGRWVCRVGPLLQLGPVVAPS